MAAGDRKDPYRGYNFKLEIQGVVIAAFHECSGLAHEEAQGDSVRKFPGVHKTGDVTFKRGVIGQLSLWPWGHTPIDGKTPRKHGSVILMEDDRPVQV